MCSQKGLSEKGNEWTASTYSWWVRGKAMTYFCTLYAYCIHHFTAPVVTCTRLSQSKFQHEWEKGPDVASLKWKILTVDTLTVDTSLTKESLSFGDWSLVSCSIPVDCPIPLCTNVLQYWSKEAINSSTAGHGVGRVSKLEVSRKSWV